MLDPLEQFFINVGSYSYSTFFLINFLNFCISVYYVRNYYWIVIFNNNFWIVTFFKATRFYDCIQKNFWRFIIFFRIFISFIALNFCVFSFLMALNINITIFLNSLLLIFCFMIMSEFQNIFEKKKFSKDTLQELKKNMFFDLRCGVTTKVELYHSYKIQRLNEYSIGQIILIKFFKFVVKVIKDNVSLKKYSCVPMFYLAFLFIFSSNLLGLVPFTNTATSHFILTLWLSLAFFIGNNLIGICYHKENYFILFLPEGVPIFIVPLLIIIEYISYSSRVLSLSIRLFANMLSGHILLKILIGFLGTLLASSISIFLIWIPFLIIFIVICLEGIISFLQAYVFLVLISIYLNDVIYTH